MMKSYADTLSTVSPVFKDKVFAKVDELLRMGQVLKDFYDASTDETR